MGKLPELLAPAGSFSALYAAIEGGADAVYLGADRFNARMRADNFTDETVKEALSLCHAYGVRSYVTLNTRLFDGELREALNLAATLYENGVSALIMADMGLASLCRRHLPDLELHASTQLSGHCIPDTYALRDAGFTRMVCQREITLSQLERLCKESPLEIEMFIHGAHCVSFSGQCLMSAVMGGRSGNRGECAQPCRQPYFKNGKKCYPLSLKDMCLASHITDICESGVASLKIEGRQKPPEYVYGVTKIYRQLLDENRNATEDELRALDSLFSRDGFTDGYLKGDHRQMLGVRTLEQYHSSEKKAFEGLKKKVSLDITLTAKKGEAPVLCAASPFKTVTVTGEKLTSDISPLTLQGAEKNAGRLGNTPYTLNKFDFITDGCAPLSLSELNGLRRRAVSLLTDAKREAVSYGDIEIPCKKIHSPVIYTAEFTDPSSVTPRAAEFFSRLYFPFGTCKKEILDEGFGVSLPPYLPDTAWDRVWSSLPSGAKLLAHSASQLTEAKKRGFEASLSLRGNVFNSLSGEYYASLGARFIILAPEMRLSKIRASGLSVPCGAVVYGRLPLMLTVRCAISDGGKQCSGKKGPLCRSAFSDRYRTDFPVFGLPDCTNIVFNSVPVYQADKMNEVYSAGVSVCHFIFTDETPEEVDLIIDAYEKGTPSQKKNIRRMP